MSLLMLLASFICFFLELFVVLPFVCLKHRRTFRGDWEDFLSIIGAKSFLDFIKKICVKVYHFPSFFLLIKLLYGEKKEKI